MKMRPHSRPFTCNDAVHAVIPQCAVRHDLGVSQDAIELGADALDRATALLIEKVRAKFDGDGTFRFERMTKKH